MIVAFEAYSHLKFLILIKPSLSTFSFVAHAFVSHKYILFPTFSRVKAKAFIWFVVVMKKKSS